MGSTSSKQTQNASSSTQSRPPPEYKRYSDNVLTKINLIPPNAEVSASTLVSPSKVRVKKSLSSNLTDDEKPHALGNTINPQELHTHPPRKSVSTSDFQRRSEKVNRDTKLSTLNNPMVSASAPIGRGRVATLPAWMTRGSTSNINLPASKSLQIGQGSNATTRDGYRSPVKESLSSELSKENNVSHSSGPIGRGRGAIMPAWMTHRSTTQETTIAPASQSVGQSLGKTIKARPILIRNDSDRSQKRSSKGVRFSEVLVCSANMVIFHLL